MTPLIYACLQNNMELVKYLVEQGAFVNSTSVSFLFFPLL